MLLSKMLTKELMRSAVLGFLDRARSSSNDASLQDASKGTHAQRGARLFGFQHEGAA
jgi:hypothetical protein